MTRDKLLRQHLRDRFVVTLDTREAFSGLLNLVDRNTVELLDAATMPDGVKVSGSLFLPRARIAYMQRLP